MNKQTENKEEVVYKSAYAEEDEAAEREMNQADSGLGMMPSKEPIVLILEKSRGPWNLHLEVKGNTMKQARAGLDYLVMLDRKIKLNPI